MASEDTVPLNNASEFSDLPPPPYEYLPKYPPFIIPPTQPNTEQDSTAPVPPYPGLDVELPKYEVVVTTQPRRCQRTEQHRTHPKTVEYLPYAVLIILAVLSIFLCFPVGVCALGYSVSALQHKRLYKERSNHVRTAIGCIMLACATGIPIHVVIWKNGF